MREDVQASKHRTQAAKLSAAANGASAKTADAELMARIAAGDPEAAKEAIDLHAGRLHALAYRMLNDTAEAEDVSQEAMLRLWKIAPEWRAGEARISTWLHRVTLNLCYDRLRKKRTTDLDEAPEQEDPAKSVQEQLEARDDAAALRKALSALPDRQRAAIILRHFEEKSNPEIAEQLDVSVEAVESLLARGRRALKAALNSAKGAQR
ncbi:MAG: RNA polymerase sigma factor [Neomegalonema sp.]|nr:RNA polymerase sigma factor [Neomegalonema sp.]